MIQSFPCVKVYKKNLELRYAKLTKDGDFFG